jgi:hypothetical protein
VRKVSPSRRRGWSRRDTQRGSRRSPARRHGRRQARRPRSVGANMTGFRRCARGDRGRGVPSPWRPCARPTWSRRGHGGAAFLCTAARDGAGTKMDQRPGLASRVTAGACWGARLREGVEARTDASANAHAMRTRRHGAAATKTGRLPTARGGWLGERRARVGEGGSTYKKMRPSLARWPASPAAVRRCGAAGVPPRLEGRGVHKREEPGVLTSVATGRSGARR